MKLIFSLFIVLALAACSSTKPVSTTDISDRSDSRSGINGNDGRSSFGMNPLQDPNNILSRRSVYYDFDSYSVANEYRDLVLAHAAYLRDNGSARVLLQGNTDERGSREYNLALGQRRADSVKSIMLLSGARDEQVESVSLGEEKPRALGNDESSWAENRRTDILHQGEY
ncbi:peptidoglycan-associated lipoprotein Pal [Nitrosomonas mobilis]|uniref:Peptidoglycan-associated lipoprotein n=1 Tax=Nitrosomonas mobilis TaxID=51642 RepID=A0A1G5SDA0_9PROT|nr:peptidoglycan-associated lipoprotein Pal [Nitrosomonas mobilis]SCZ85173.1 Outer membrane protein P6 [Nitrosomonas mobilis]HNO75440.1 peptidoglycan-associated lipoprotein Pal [Nitrosomonas mobilis]